MEVVSTSNLVYSEAKKKQQQQQQQQTCNYGMNSNSMM